MRVFLMDSSSLSRNPSFTEWILCSSYILFFSSYHDILSLTDFINYLFTELIQMPTLMQVFRVKLWWNTIWVVVFWTDGSSENIESINVFDPACFQQQMFFSGAFQSAVVFFFFLPWFDSCLDENSGLNLSDATQLWNQTGDVYLVPPLLLNSNQLPSLSLVTPCLCPSLSCLVYFLFLTCWTSPQCFCNLEHVRVSLLLSVFFFFFCIVWCHCVTERFSAVNTHLQFEFNILVLKFDNFEKSWYHLSWIMRTGFFLEYFPN